MAIESAADRLSMLDPDEFGVAATYNGGSTVNGIFDREYFAADIGAEVPVESNQPVFTCRTSDVSSATHGDTLVVSGVSYTVVGVQPDGTGVTVLILEAV